MSSVCTNDDHVETEDDHVEATGCSDSAFVALSNIIVIESIFNNLNARELNNCSRVCKLWRDGATKAKHSRKQLQWQSFAFEEDGFVPDIWWSTINSYLLESAIEPRSVMMFCTDVLWQQVGRCKWRGRRTSTDISDLFPFSLPRDCSIHITVTDGVVATYEDMKTQEYDEYEMVISLVVFGQSVGLELVPFSCGLKELKVVQKLWTEKTKTLPPSLAKLKKKSVKMVNLFCPMSGIDQEVVYSMFATFGLPLVAGGYVNEKYVRPPAGTFNRYSSEVLMSGMAVCGGDVQVASVLIQEEVDTEQQVDAIVRDLADKHLPLDNSVGFMYACVGRGIHMYDGIHNVESKVFRKYFPKTPLFGFFGNGEIGCCYPPIDPLFVSRKRKASSQEASGEEKAGAMSEAQLKRQLEEVRRKDLEYRLKHPPKLLHAYTTVMCLVSLPVHHR